MIGYVFDEKWANANQDKVARFIAMTRKAKEILSTSDAEWEKIAPLTGAPDAATCAPTAIAIGKEFRVARSPTRKPTRAFSIACWLHRRPRTCRAGARTRFRHILSRDPGD
jgi:hypothetical protein